ncbi:MAG: bifunctional ADP-heptose synthase [Bacteroidota bacterium]
MPEENKISKLFQEFNKKNVMIIGDVMIDAYLWGKVDRISPEAPVPVVALHKRENRLGGAANVALNIKAMGATPILCTVIGNDRQSEIFFELMEVEKMKTCGLIRSNDRLTTTKFRVIGNNVQMLRVDEETTLDLNAEEEKNLFEEISLIIEENEVSAIIFQDYNKGVLTPTLIKKLIQLAREKGIPTTVDPKKQNFLAYRGVTLFKPNLKELREGLKMDIEASQPEVLEDASSRFQDQQDIDIMLLTLSEHGIMIRKKGTDRQSETHFIAAHKRNIADVSGAGDTVISLATLCLASGCSLREIAAISNLAGGLVCEEVGVVPIKGDRLLQEVLRELKE